MILLVISLLLAFKSTKHNMSRDSAEILAIMGVFELLAEISLTFIVLFKALT